MEPGQPPLHRKRRHRRRKSGAGLAASSRALFAAIDLGTNNCRLLVARRETGGLHVVDSFSRIVRLGERMAQTGILSDAAMERTVAALKICAERIARHENIRVRAVATAACRRATNTDILTKRVYAETGLKLDVVSAEEEARLAALGCAPLVGRQYQGALVFDIGGGSTEVIWLKRPPARPLAQGEQHPAGKAEMVHFCSTPVGVMTLAEMENTRYDEMYAAMLVRFGAMREEMDTVGQFDPAGYHLLGTSGTVTTLAGIALDLPRYVRSRVDGTWHDCTDMDKVISDLIGLDRPARATLGCVGEERADLIIPGCAIYNAIRTVWPCARLRVADRGLREGILRDMMKEV